MRIHIKRWIISLDKLVNSRKNNTFFTICQQKLEFSSTRIEFSLWNAHIWLQRIHTTVLRVKLSYQLIFPLQRLYLYSTVLSFTLCQECWHSISAQGTKPNGVSWEREKTHEEGVKKEENYVWQLSSFNWLTVSQSHKLRKTRGHSEGKR